MSVGALYRYFDGKQAILMELYSRVVSGLRQRILEGFSLSDLVGPDVRHLLRKVMVLAFQLYSERPGLRRVLTEQARKIPALQELRRAQEDEVFRAVRQILDATPAVHLPDHEVGAFLISLFMASLIDDHTNRQGVSRIRAAWPLRPLAW